MNNEAWVIKDNQNNFVHKHSIKTSGKKVLYISSKTFSPESRGYVSKERAEEAVKYLNEQSIIYGFKQLSFRVELANLSEITKKNKEFIGENLVVIEKDIRRVLSKAM